MVFFIQYEIALPTVYNMTMFAKVAIWSKFCLAQNPPLWKFPRLAAFPGGPTWENEFFCDYYIHVHILRGGGGGGCSGQYCTLTPPPPPTIFLIMVMLDPTPPPPPPHRHISTNMPSNEEAGPRTVPLCGQISSPSLCLCNILYNIYIAVIIDNFVN